MCSRKEIVNLMKPCLVNRITIHCLPCLFYLTHFTTYTFILFFHEPVHSIFYLPFSLQTDVLLLSIVTSWVLKYCNVLAYNCTQLNTFYMSLGIYPKGTN